MLLLSKKSSQNPWCVFEMADEKAGGGLTAAVCSVEAAVPLLVLHKSMRLIRHHHGTWGNTEAFWMSSVLVITER